MSRTETYLDLIDWDDSLSQAERENRGPFLSAFGIGYGHAAGDAVEQARRAAAIADDVLVQVKQQAVYALLAEDLSVRAVAKRTGISKTEVSRISRRLGRDGDLPGSVGTVHSAPNEVRERVRAAWGHR